MKNHMTTKTTMPWALSLLFVLSCGVSQSFQKLGEAGGTLEMAGLKIKVPAGALEKEVVLTAREGERRGGEREFEIEPNDLRLRGEIEIEVELESEHGLELRHLDRSQSRTERVERQNDDHVGTRHQLRGWVKRLGAFTVRRSDDSSNHDIGDDHGGAGGGRGGDDDCRDGGTGGGNGHDDGDDRGGSAGGTGGNGGGTGGSGGGTGGSNPPGARCVDDDTCACGSECVSGACTAVVVCTSDAQCASGSRCRAAKKHGDACGVQACHP